MQFTSQSYNEQILSEISYVRFIEVKINLFYILPIQNIRHSVPFELKKIASEVSIVRYKLNGFSCEVPHVLFFDKIGKCDKHSNMMAAESRVVCMT